MKTRSGFVSNSSSSSFVLFGTYTDAEVEEDVLEEHGLQMFESDEDGPCIGVDPDEMKSKETLTQFRERIAKQFAAAGIEVKPADLSFTGGSYYC